MLTRRRLLAGLLAAPMAARVAHGADPLGPGEHPLGLDRHRDGVVYVPRRYRPDTPAALAVFFHGAGGTSASVYYTFELADEHGVIILAPDSRDERTWDLVLGDYGPDADFLSRALGSVFERCRVDRSRLVLGGHSDGASYALSFGIGAGEVFGHILAFSPGVLSPVAVSGKPKIFVSHGEHDQVMPVEETSRRFVPRLAKLGYEVTYHEYDGRHGVPADVVRKGFAWAFGGADVSTPLGAQNGGGRP